MNWLNLELKTLRSTEYLGADPVQRATWINLLSFCADHENGGFIAEASEWGDRKWMQLVGVTLSEVTSECGLWDATNGGFSVKHYPLLQEQKVRRNRRNGKKGGRPSADKPDGLPCGYPDGSADGSVSLKRNSNSNSNRKGKKEISAPEPAKLENEQTATSPYSEEFLEFWSAYPNKKGKGGAWRSWKKEAPPLIDALRSLEMQKADSQWVKDNGQFIPHPQTWINARRWEDEQEFMPFTQTSTNHAGIPLCNGLTRQQFKEKWGKVA